MTAPKWLALIGGVLAIVGILTAFLSSHYNEADRQSRSSSLGARRGQPGNGKGTAAMAGQFWFYFGLMLTAVGIVLQTVGSILPLNNGN